MKQANCVDMAKAGCGEGLLWDHTRHCLWWVDISGEKLHRFDPATGTASRIDMPYLISALALRQDGELLIATARGLGHLNASTGAIDILHDPEPEISGNRLNDMAVDQDGQLWLGTMSEGAKGATGALYRYGPQGISCEKTETTISNGLDWSPDNRRLYFIDSVPGVMYVFDGQDWRVLRQFDETTGRPDGMCVDTAGTLWVAICDQGRILGLSPAGDIIEDIAIPCEIVTNCAFGGAEMKTLFVTTGTFSMSAEEKAANPLAGGLFAIEMEVAGRAQNMARWPAS